jgi:hypothetical protein
MTLGKLIKELQKLEKKHGNRIPVCADTRTLRESCNDVWQIVDLTEADSQLIEMVDGDGFKAWNKNGVEKMKLCVVLK